MVHCVLALGSNIGNKAENIKKAYTELNNFGIEIVSKSSFYNNPAYGYEDQEDFVNSVILAKTEYCPEELLDAIKVIEKKLGRLETFRWGPRIIDIDIIFYDNIKYNSEKLFIPHKDYKNRDFVLKPLEEIKQDLKIYNIIF
ncbi:MAG: 2-amino-4-hydroxy-6-hydroxymethyldihydropteridine diphosphokinase [Abditibacteriota bacterium]|nr:2-amino-4-hydroxy-6-hydroxymethyldihydropteridine diphosphokinase [Abditibacteriota bacterium]